MSRDCGELTIHDSEKDARTVFAEAKQTYASIGYVPWFAYMYDNQGNKTVLDTAVPYN